MITLRTSLPFRRLVLLGLGIFLLLPRLFALDPSRTVFPNTNFQTWNRQNGLPFNRISAITQTSDGYLWMGTQNGLVRFDGIDFTNTAIPKAARVSMNSECQLPEGESARRVLVWIGRRELRVFRWDEPIRRT